MIHFFFVSIFLISDDESIDINIVSNIRNLELIESRKDDEKYANNS